jgi:hypothetical protein
MQPKEDSATERDEYNNKRVGSADVAKHDNETSFVKRVQGRFVFLYKVYNLWGDSKSLLASLFQREGPVHMAIDIS